jgi:hypothetical protein
MDVNPIKVLTVTLVAVLSLALGASSTVAYQQTRPGETVRPQEKCGDVVTDQRDRENKWLQVDTNCDHFRNR